MGGVGYGLGLEAKQALKLAPQQYLASTLLASTVQDLRTELQHKMEKNPAIEDVTWKGDPVLSSVSGSAPGAGASGADADRPLDFTPDGPAAERQLATGGVRDEFFTNSEGGSSDDWMDARSADIRAHGSAEDAEREERRRHLFESVVRAESLDEHLRRQVTLADFTPEDRQLAEMLVGGINEDGYLEVSVAEIVMNSGRSAADVERVLARIRTTFDPPGVGSRNLRECLLAQMDLFDDSPWEDEIRDVVEHHLDDLCHGRDEKIRTAMGLSPEDWQHVKRSFRLFARKPALQHWNGEDRGAGRVTGPDRPRYIYPEVHAVKKNGRWCAVVTDGALPKIVISKEVRRLAEDSDVPSADRAMIRNYVREAEELEDMLTDRQEKIRDVAQAVIDAQPGYFEKGPSGLRPLTQHQIAERLHLSDSVVSRAVKDKYMTTPFGTVEIGSLFASGVSAEGGLVTQDAVRARLVAMIAREDPAAPISDDELMRRLQAEGVDIKRRTVAKYRELEHIPNSSKRRRRE